MSDKTTIKPLIIALGAAFVGSLAGGAIAAGNPFAQTELTTGHTLVVAEAKCGGKMKDSKCGGKMGKDGVRGPAKFDTDGDGKVTLEEFNAGHAKMFQKMDTDGDGVLSGDELKRSGMKCGAGGDAKSGNAGE